MPWVSTHSQYSRNLTSNQPEAMYKYAKKKNKNRKLANRRKQKDVGSESGFECQTETIILSGELNLSIYHHSFSFSKCHYASVCLVLAMGFMAMAIVKKNKRKACS